MKLNYFLMACVLTLGMVACDSTNSTNDVIGDQPAVCNPTAANVYQGCLTFREEVCSKFVDCASFGSMNECETWFDNPDNYGGCDSTFTDPVASAQKYAACICAIPDANCAALSDPGVITTIPACGEWIPAQ